MYVKISGFFSYTSTCYHIVLISSLFNFLILEYVGRCFGGIDKALVSTFNPKT